MIKLTLDEPLYALYKEDTGEYIYLTRGDFELKPYPKPSGMAPTLLKVQKKHEGLLRNLEKWATEGYYVNPNETDDQVWERCKRQYHSRAQFDEIQARRLAFDKERFNGRLEVAKKFTIVKLSVEKVVLDKSGGDPFSNPGLSGHGGGPG